jgi:hypothetical protein
LSTLTINNGKYISSLYDPHLLLKSEIEFDEDLKGWLWFEFKMKCFDIPDASFLYIDFGEGFLRKMYLLRQVR